MQLAVDSNRQIPAPGLGPLVGQVGVAEPTGDAARPEQKGHDIFAALPVGEVHRVQNPRIWGRQWER